MLGSRGRYQFSDQRSLCSLHSTRDRRTTRLGCHHIVSEQRKASRNKFVKKGGVPDRAKSLRELDCSKNCPRSKFGFVKPIRNGLGKKQNLIQGRPFWAETSLAGRENEVRYQKNKEKSTLNRMRLKML